MDTTRSLNKDQNKWIVFSMIMVVALPIAASSIYFIFFGQNEMILAGASPFTVRFAMVTTAALTPLSIAWVTYLKNRLSVHRFVLWALIVFTSIIGIVVHQSIGDILTDPCLIHVCNIPL